MNFFNIIKKGTNARLNSLKDSAIYEIAREKLEPKSYAILAKPLYLVSQFFSSAYHILSFCIALIGITIYALQLDSILQKSILVLISFILLAIVEVAKSNASNTVFSSVARKEQPNKLFLVILLVTTVFSFFASVMSAKESIYFASTNTKFSNIDSLQNSKIDSINLLYSTQINALQSSIESNTNTIKTKKGWQNNVAQTNLQANQTSLTNILEKKEKSLQLLQDNKTSSYKSTSDKGKEIAIFAAVLFAVFELLNLIAYWFIYNYYQSCLLEPNLINDHVITPPLNEPVKTPSTVREQLQTITENSQIIPKQPYNNEIYAPTKQPLSPQKIGFQFNVVEAPTEPKTENNNEYIYCANCNEKTERKTHNHKFCSTNCRVQNWEKEKGAKISFSKK
jgi:hypothetical protein